MKTRYSKAQESDLLRQDLYGLLAGHLPEILKNLTTQAKNGNVQAAKLALDFYKTCAPVQPRPRRRR